MHFSFSPKVIYFFALWSIHTKCLTCDRQKKINQLHFTPTDLFCGCPLIGGFYVNYCGYDIMFWFPKELFTRAVRHSWTDYIGHLSVVILVMGNKSLLQDMLLSPASFLCKLCMIECDVRWMYTQRWEKGHSSLILLLQSVCVLVLHTKMKQAVNCHEQIDKSEKKIKLKIEKL